MFPPWTSGIRRSSAACSSSKTCIDGECGGECGPGQKRCDERQPQLCSASGAFVDDGAECSGSTPVCADGACKAAASTERISISSSGAQANDESKEVSISGDGRYVAFSSAATNLVSDDTNGQDDVFVRDRLLGATTRISVGSSGAQGNGSSDFPSISEDGRYVAFVSRANNLVAGLPSGLRQDVYVHDRQTGTLELISVNSAGAAGNAESLQPSISADGRFVAFESLASNLVSGDTNGLRDAFLRDRQAGTTVLLAPIAGGGVANGFSGEVSLSGDGRYAVFRSSASNLVANDTNGFEDVFLRDLVSGTTELFSVGPGGVQGDEWSIEPTISRDGSFIAFCSEATNFVSGDTNGFFDVFARPRAGGVMTRVNVDSAGAQSNSLTEGRPSLSNDGQYVALISYATNLVPGDTNNKRDVFVRRLW